MRLIAIFSFLLLLIQYLWALNSFSSYVVWPVTLGSSAKMHPALTFQFERAVNEYAQWQAVPAEDRSDAPAWWWDTALAAVDETATMPVEWSVTLGVADGSTYAKGAEVFKNALLEQTYLPRSENFPRKFKAIDAAAIVPKSP